MKTKKILMSLLLVMGAIAAKASGFPPELALVSQPVMVYNYNSVTVYYDVENIGDYTYRGYVYLYLDPDDGYPYAEEYVKVRPGRIKRISIDIPSYRIDPYFVYTIMPYYELGNELYSFTTFEYFEPLYYHWHGTRTAYWIVVSAPPRVRHYTRPGTYRYYYDGYRPPMPPPGHGPGMPPPMDPMHHTYNYHHNNGGYPVHNEWNNGEAPKPSHNEAPTPNNGGNATVRPKPNGGSMSSGNSGNSGGSNSGTVNPPAPSTRPRTNSGSVSGRTNNGSSRPSGTSTGSSSSGRTNNSGTSSGRTNSNSGSSRVNNSSNSGSRTSGTSTSSSSSSSSSRSSGSSSSGSSTRSSNSSSTRSSGTSSSSSSSSTRSGNSSSGRR